MGVATRSVPCSYITEIEHVYVIFVMSMRAHLIYIHLHSIRPPQI